MTNSVGLLSNRVKKVPSTQVDENRYSFLRLQDSEPDLGVPTQNGNFLVSSVTGQRVWSAEVLYNQNQQTLELHNSHALKGTKKSIQTQLETVLTTFSTFDYGSAKLLIQVFDTTTSQRQVSELLVIHDGDEASATEYSILFTGNSPLATYDVTIDGIDVVVTAVASTENPLEYKICETLMLS
jgi:hypothetical protein